MGNVMSDKTKALEFWLAGDPNEYDAGIWYDHLPQTINDSPFWRHHVIEKSAYDALLADRLELLRVLKIIADILPEFKDEPRHYKEVIADEAIAESRKRMGEI